MRWRDLPGNARLRRRFPSTAITIRKRRAQIKWRRLEAQVRGLVDNKKSWTLEELYKLPKQGGPHVNLRRGLERDRKLDRHSVRDFLHNGCRTRAKY